MEITDKNIKVFSLIFIVLVLAVLAFLLVRPIIISIIGGLILAYTFFPLYALFLKFTKSKNLSATIVSLFAIALIVAPVYFLAPLMINQVFELFIFSQNLEINNIIELIFPSAPEPFVVQMIATYTSLISEISSTILNALVDFLLGVPTLLFNLVIVAFVFFYALRDHDKLAGFVSGLSPIHKSQEKKLIDRFKNITNSIVYGQILVGLVQGIGVGIGLLIFNVPNALILTVLATILSIVPILGPFFVWVPVSIFLYSTGNSIPATIFLLYNLIIVSNLDNLFRTYIVSRKTKLSQVIVLVGMVGGLFFFGILGLILGPLILAYFIIFLEAYRQKTFSSLFKE